MPTPKKSPKKKRSPNWSINDACLIVQIYEKYHDICIGKFSGSTVTSEKKEAAWKKLADEINQSAVDHQ